ncbi:hypothetical protein C8Q78DRAFT_455868 [Trametes maxima]|nr:hypothetical protein C8Q78DRAFT_455868 [Trametes maxima]
MLRCHKVALAFHCQASSATPHCAHSIRSCRPYQSLRPPPPSKRCGPYWGRSREAWVRGTQGRHGVHPNWRGRAHPCLRYAEDRRRRRRRHPAGGRNSLRRVNGALTSRWQRPALQGVVFPKGVMTGDKLRPRGAVGNGACCRRRLGLLYLYVRAAHHQLDALREIQKIRAKLTSICRKLSGECRERDRRCHVRAPPQRDPRTERSRHRPRPEWRI